MAIDLAAIRKRMAELNGNGKKSSNIQLWKPTPGEYRIRCLPWKNSPDGQPFAEKWFYYLDKIPGFLAPKQFGKPDPVADLIHKLYSSGKSEDRAMAKELHAKMRAYAPVIVKGQEDKGVQVWSFGKLVYGRLLSFFVDEDGGDFLDPLEGHEIKVTITQQPGKQHPDTTCDLKAKKPLHEDPKKIQELLESVPNIDDMYRLKTKEEIEAILNTWLSGGESSSSDEGTARGAPSGVSALDSLVNEVKKTASPAPVVEEQKVPAKAKAKKVVDIDDAPVAPKKQSLDEAFEDLMEDPLAE